MKKPFMFAFLALTMAALHGQAVVYVDANATGANTGADWPNAYASLRTAIDSSPASAQLWVAKGTYIPGASRTDSFVLKNGMHLYGGFTSGMTSLSQRDWNANPTILSGEVQGDGSLANNAYHILIANTNAVLNGFVLTGGAANGTAPADKGGAIYGSYVGRDNSVNWPQTIANCVFTNNAALSGGAVYGDYSSYYVTNAVFALNVATNGGAMYLNNFSNSRKVQMNNCIFNQNSAVQQGGAVFANSFQSWPVTACQFIGNTAGSSGGAISHASPWMADGLYRCLFIGNRAGGTGNGGAVNYGNPGLNIYGSTFVMNSAGGGQGGAIAPFNANPLILVYDSTFVGNLSKADGGAMYANGRALRARNCLFAGTVSTNGSGGAAGITTRDATYRALLTNCTFSCNWAKVGGGAEYIVAGKPVTNVNSILWGNTATAAKTPNQISGTSGGCNYSDIQGGWAIGADNMNSDPLFAGGPSGTWTAVGAYNAVDGRTVLTSSGANWTPGMFAGLCINTDTSQHLQTLIVTNTATTITVWGNVAAFTASGDAYQIWDYHLKSKGGRWTPLQPLPANWVTDSVHSPCIDAGNPASAYALEPQKNGARINMGAYGNTLQASMAKPDAKGSMVIVR